jgi:hypothetical protein
MRPIIAPWMRTIREGRELQTQLAAFGLLARLAGRLVLVAGLVGVLVGPAGMEEAFSRGLPILRRGDSALTPT